MGEKTSTNHNARSSDPRMDFLCFNLSVFPRNTQFVLLVTITFVFFLLYGYMQELMYKLPGFSDFPWYLTLVQFFMYAVFAMAESKIRQEKRK